MSKRSYIQIYLQEGDEERIDELMEKLVSLGVDLTGGRRNPTYSELVRFLVRDKLDQLEADEEPELSAPRIPVTQPA